MSASREWHLLNYMPAAWTLSTCIMCCCKSQIFAGVQELWHQEYTILAQRQGRWEATVQRLRLIFFQKRITPAQAAVLKPWYTACT
eukprot:1158449-Pelagomonas_calceolata.AAC.2